MFKKIFDLLDQQQKLKIYYYQIPSFIQGVLEAIGVVSVLPLMYVLTAENKDQIFSKFFFLKNFLESMSFIEIQLILIFLFIGFIVILNLVISYNFFLSESIIQKIYINLFSRLINLAMTQFSDDSIIRHFVSIY